MEGVWGGHRRRQKVGKAYEQLLESYVEGDVRTNLLEQFPTKADAMQGVERRGGQASSEGRASTGASWRGPEWGQMKPDPLNPLPNSRQFREA